MPMATVVKQISAVLKTDLSLPNADYFLDATENLAIKLVGDFLFRVEMHNEQTQICGGRIVETEAYLDVSDPASHAATKQITGRNQILYSTGGTAYVFRSYGVHHCFNVIARPAGAAGCVLIRALEPLAGIDLMTTRRGKNTNQLYDLCSGPGKLCQALGINQTHTGANLRNSELLILQQRQPTTIQIEQGPRIGISRATERKLRFWQRNSRWTSN